MPSNPLPKLRPGKQARAHIAEAKSNYDRYSRFAANTDDTGWAIVVLFYSALHLVQAHAVTRCPALREKIPNSHVDRNSYVSRHLGNIDLAYRNLRDASEDFRYKLRQPETWEPEQYRIVHYERIRTYLADRGMGW